MLKLILIFSFLTISTIVFGQSLGETSNTLALGADFIAKAMWAACIVVGIVLVTVAFAQYQEHRHNPKLVPLANPITYLLLAVVTFSIPFAGRILGWQIAVEEGGKQQVLNYIDIDATDDDED